MSGEEKKEKEYVYLKRFENYTKHQHELRTADNKKTLDSISRLWMAVIFEALAIITLAIALIFV